MKLFIYSDVHISRTSSILPLKGDDEWHTYRQSMIINTAKWMNKIIEEQKPDMVINLGDTFDQNMVTSYDIETASEFFKEFKTGTPHFILCGNHEMLNSEHNVLALLNNINGMTVIDTPTAVQNLLFIPYCEYKELDLSNYNGSDYLFTHLDIYGSKVAPGRVLDFGIETSQLEKFKRVFNGHVHASSNFANVHNVGSVTTHSFADSSESLPSCYIFDTETMETKTFFNTNCPLFRKVELETEQDIVIMLNNVVKDAKWNFVLNVVCNFDIKDKINEYLKDVVNIISYKVVTKSIRNNNEELTEHNEIVNIESSLDVKKSFRSFLETGIELKYPLKLYDEVIENNTTKVTENVTISQSGTLF